MVRTAQILLLCSLLLTACGGTSTAPPKIEVPTAADPASAPDVDPEGQPSSGPASFVVVPEESEARFRIDEVLSGQDNEVVGITSAIEGSFQLDLENTTGASYDPIVIEASTFVTDNQRRNGAIQRFILQTGQPENELITFQPIEIGGMPDSVAVGENYELAISGDLTIRGVTRQETFTGVVSAISVDRLQGSMSTETAWADYDISIPQVPMVASVDDQLTLEIDFIAVRQ